MMILETKFSLKIVKIFLFCAQCFSVEICPVTEKRFSLAFLCYIFYKTKCYCLLKTGWLRILKHIQRYKRPTVDCFSFDILKFKAIKTMLR